MQQLLCLFGDCSRHRWVRVAQAANGDSAQCIQITVALFVPNVGAIAAHHHGGSGSVIIHKRHSVAKFQLTTQGLTSKHKLIRANKL